MGSCGTTGEAESTTTEFRCVQCGFPVKTLYIQYSPGNIRLGNCKAVADGYIECEVMILILDLILHKPKAYRHVFYNIFSKETAKFESLLWKLVLVYEYMCCLICSKIKCGFGAQMGRSITCLRALHHFCWN